MLAVPAAALLLAGCGSGDTTPTQSAASSATSSSGAAAGPSLPASCAPGSPTSTDDFHEQVALTTLSNGMQIGDIKVGTGAQPHQGQTISVQYTGWLQNGCVFDTSRQPGRTAFSTPIGTGQVIPGWDQGILTMKVGGKRRLVIPPGLAYGAQGYPPAIPGNATLVFDVELLSVS